MRQPQRIYEYVEDSGVSVQLVDERTVKLWDDLEQRYPSDSRRKWHAGWYWWSTRTPPQGPFQSMLAAYRDAYAYLTGGR